jgi:hypothetical protein
MCLYSHIHPFGNHVSSVIVGSGPGLLALTSIANQNIPTHLDWTDVSFDLKALGLHSGFVNIIYCSTSIESMCLWQLDPHIPVQLFIDCHSFLLTPLMLSGVI